MGSQAISILVEGIWASFTGGWYYDKKQSHFSNLFHLYIWLIFLCYPLVNFLFVNTQLSWILYCIIIAITFVCIKICNFYLHCLFDTGKCIKKESVALDDQLSGSKEDGENQEKDAFEMTVMSQSNDLSNNNSNNLDQQQNVPDSQNIDLVSEKGDSSSLNKINFKADVHCTDVESVNAIDLSGLFEPKEDDSFTAVLIEKDSPEKSVSNNSSRENVTISDTYLMNIKPTCSKNNQLNKSMGTVENISYDQMSTFRRARSELETIKTSGDNRKPTVEVPPSHPVSMEVINKRKKEENNLDTGRFNNDSINVNLNQISDILDRRMNEDLNSNLEQIEEKIESPLSSTYIRERESSEDGDESEVSFYANACPNKQGSRGPPVNRKPSKQPMRKHRYSFRKRVSSKSSHTDVNVKTPVQGESGDNKRKHKGIVFLKTSDEESDSEFDEDDRHLSSKSNDKLKYDISTSSIPSSSSSSSSLASFLLEGAAKRREVRDYRIISSKSLHAPSTSTGITRVYRKKRAPHFPARPLSNSDGKPNKRSLTLQSTIEDGQQPSTSRAVEPSQQLMVRRSRSNSNREDDNLKVLANVMSDAIVNGKHLATSHEDTTLGSVHVFQDERGNWFSYTFDENSAGTARGLFNVNPCNKVASHEESKSSGMVQSDSIYFVNNYAQPKAVCGPSSLFADKEGGKANNRSSNSDSSLSSLQRTMFSQLMPDMDLNCINSGRPFLVSPVDFISSLNNNYFPQSTSFVQKKDKPVQYYEIKVFNLTNLKIHFDRLSLLAFLDRNQTICELVLSILLALSVAVFASILLFNNFFHDLSLVLFCLVLASSQYTLLKSVQPDAASPTHGFNRYTIYSRPIYFCLMSIILLACNHYLYKNPTSRISFYLYDVSIVDRTVVSNIFALSRLFLLSFPVLFTIGLLPQFNTFLMYFLEQIDIHVFGGTASTMGIISALYSFFRSISVAGLLYLLAMLFNIQDNQKATFSVFCGLLMMLSFFVSRMPSDPSYHWNLVCRFSTKVVHLFHSLIHLTSKSSPKPPEVPSPPTPELHELLDPLPKKMRQTIASRLESDLISCVFMTILVFGVHVSSIFKLQPYVNNYTTVAAIAWGFILHYIFTQFRKQLPWSCLANPLFKSKEYKRFEVDEPAKIMWFEKIQAWMWMLEKNVVLPLLFLGHITSDTPLLIKYYGSEWGTLILVLCAFKCFRSTFNDPSPNYLIVLFTFLLFNYDYKFINGEKENIFLMNYFVVSILYHKINDFLLKFRFVITYVAPWQITWGSAFHAFAQPFSVPHSAMLLVQICVSSLLSSPLQPIFGSAIFFTSYVRPVKFWERDYNTKRVDHSNTRLASQIDKAQIGSDDNNLNSIFYEQLTRSLQHSLYGDLVLGRWGLVNQGDCFVLASDNLNCLVHIIEFGNGLVTFQVRGLEFRGTYCQQREVEAISESVSDDEGCCCCEPGHFSGSLSVNAAFNQRWLSWEVTHTNYILEGYSISENHATTMLQPYDLRRSLITYYVKSIIYYCISYKSFLKWIGNGELAESLSYLSESNFVDLDPTFNYNIDEDFDVMFSGITRHSFTSVYNEWIKYCLNRCLNATEMDYVAANEEFLISLLLGLSLLARRALGTASNNSSSLSVDLFLYGFHALFKGDFRVHSTRDEWVFQDMDFMNKVIAPSVRMSLKLHQDQFTLYEEYEDSASLFEAIMTYQKSIVVSHEADPVWRNAILSNVPSLLALRHVFDDGSDQYKIIMLNKRYLNFRVIKINRECVRGLWAGQQQELIFLRNRNPERGSIQNAKQVLRNIINSSCDQPIGYPIYVSPLTTSFAESSSQLSQVIGPSLTISMFKRAIFGFFQKICNRCSEVCSGSGSGGNAGELAFNSRLSKSESSDKGIDDTSRTFCHAHTQKANYLYIKKRNTMERNEEEAIPLQNLVNLPVNRGAAGGNVMSVYSSSINVPENAAATNAANLTVSKSSKESSSLGNADSCKSILMERTTSHHSKGDAV